MCYNNVINTTQYKSSMLSYKTLVQNASLIFLAHSVCLTKDTQLNSLRATSMCVCVCVCVLSY